MAMINAGLEYVDVARGRPDNEFTWLIKQGELVCIDLQPRGEGTLEEETEGGSESGGQRWALASLPLTPLRL